MQFVMRAAAVICVLAAFAAPAHADGEVAFAYQGRVKVQGNPFTGTGQFKFSVLDTSGTATLWSHDGTGENGNAPTGHIELPVQDGIFNVMVGDTSVTTSPINATIFNSQTALKLRVWFNDGTRGFQQLNPDHNLVNLTLNVLETGQQDFTIYVDGTNGSDSNNGLTASTAKKTIQAAVDSLPDRINCNVTVDIADGEYKEAVTVHGLSAAPGKTITLQGDDTWTSVSAGTPSVLISGADSGSTPVRDWGINAKQCSGLGLRGIHFQYCIYAGLILENGSYNVSNCLATGNQKWAGIKATRGADANFIDCTSRDNDGSGFWISVSSRGNLTSCIATGNKADGVFVQAQSSCDLMDTGNYSSNDGSGLRVWAHSYIGCDMPLYMTINNNKTKSVALQYHCYMTAYTYNKNLGNITLSGNGSPVNNAELIEYGSSIWW